MKIDFKKALELEDGCKTHTESFVREVIEVLALLALLVSIPFLSLADDVKRIITGRGLYEDK